MKKAIGTAKAVKAKTKSITWEQLRDRKLTTRQREEIAALSRQSDDQIDTSDIPEILAKTGWIKKPMYRPITQPVTIRLNAPDIAAARALSKSKGLPYQTYIKQLLHDALTRELSSRR